jgi:U3 small nucleolar RNA-associated protein 14
MLAAVKAQNKPDEDDGEYHEPASAENEYGVPAGSQGIRAAGKLSLGSLIASMKDNKNLGDAVKNLEKLKASKPVAVPLPTVLAARAARETGYEDTCNVVSEWQPIVKQNREKEQVQFPLRQPGRFNVSSATLAASFKPRTSLEEEIQAHLKASGADEASLKKTEELELRKLSVEEVKQRQAELASMRSLLFHAEIRAKRINRIKSKKFRKVDRKYKEKSDAMELSQLKEVDPEEYRKRVMDAERKRAEERVSLKHKNTSK